MLAFTEPRPAQASPSSIHWDCPRFSDNPESRAAVEARSQVELSLVAADGGELAITCADNAAIIALRVPDARGLPSPARVARVALPTADERAVDAMVDGVWHLARRPPAPTSRPAVVASRAAAPPAVPRAPAWRWEVAAGVAAQVMGGALSGWAGPTVGAGLGTLHARFGLSAGFAEAMTRVETLRISSWSAAAFGELHALGPLMLGVSAGAMRLNVSAPGELTPSSQGTWTPDLTLCGRLRERGAHWGFSIGPELHYRWLSPLAAIDGDVAFRLPHLSLGAAAELSFEP